MHGLHPKPVGPSCRSKLRTLYGHQILKARNIPSYTASVQPLAYSMDWISVNIIVLDPHHVLDEENEYERG